MESCIFSSMKEIIIYMKKLKHFLTFILSHSGILYLSRLTSDNSQTPMIDSNKPRFILKKLSSRQFACEPSIRVPLQIVYFFPLSCAQVIADFKLQMLSGFLWAPSILQPCQFELMFTVHDRAS